MKKNLDITKPRSSEKSLPVPWPFVMLRFHCITEDTVFMFLTGEGTDSSTSFEQRRAKAVPSLLCCFKY